MILRNPVWSGLFGPAALPSDIVQANVAAIHRAIKDPELMQWASSVSVDLVNITPAEFQLAFREEYEAVTALIRKAGIKDPGGRTRHVHTADITRSAGCARRASVAAYR